VFALPLEQRGPAFQHQGVVRLSSETLSLIRKGAGAMLNQRNAAPSDTRQKQHYLEAELLEALRASPDLFWFLEEGSLDGVWYWDLEKPDHEWLSPRFKSLFGYHDDEMEHSPAWWQANIHPDDLDAALEAFEKHKQDPTYPYDVTVRYRHKNGTTVHVRCRGLIIRNDEGKPIRMLGAHTDVTGYMDAKERFVDAARYNQTIMDTVPDGLQLWRAVRSDDGNIVDLELLEMNRAAEEIVGRSRAVLVNRPLSETFPGNFEDGLFERYRSILERQTGDQFEISYRHEGLDHSFRVTVNPHSSEEIVISFADITDLRRAQSSLEDQNRKVSEVNEQLRQFTYVASHDLQEPLRKIASFSDMLVQDIEAEDYDGVRYAADVVTKSASRARQLVQDVLMYSRSQNRELQLQNTDLVASFSGVVDEFAEDIKRHDIACHVDMEPCTILADEMKLHRLLLNLMSNAVKYRRADKGAKINVVGRQSAERYELVIQDNGVGFDMQMRDHAFQPFKRLHPRSEYDGSGIGLAICAAICERHGWAIDVHSAVGEGSTFSVTF
jgi:PAS domain S-box-containing protein